mmetsp:Transcript_103420/g.267672  ORF Transcript_103420/g.267672 Transcript_103420/m.267672 type:complete len:124 (-) Transcript_103420:78-449(-)
MGARRPAMALHQVSSNHADRLICLSMQGACAESSSPSSWRRIASSCFSPLMAQLRTAMMVAHILIEWRMLAMMFRSRFRNFSTVVRLLQAIQGAGHEAACRDVLRNWALLVGGKQQGIGMSGS